MKNLLTLVAVFKNEARALPEWIEHYLTQGCDKLILVDNKSDDNWRSECIRYFSESRVDFLEDHRKWAQVSIYNKIFESYRNSSECFMICDLDEFIYPRNDFRSIREFILTLDDHPEWGCIKIPWKLFGSSNHVKHPKGGIIKNFTWRKLYNNNSRVNVKYICRTDGTESLGCHVPKLKTGYKYLDSKKAISDDSPFLTINEATLQTENLHINHYAIQSEEFFREVKMTRGCALNKNAENVRTMNYFKAYDKNDIEDKELALLVKP
tara:strand:- start:969 stop:1766 length:798 start_codon:yes stop_codon:yes gene_type:complete